MRHLFLGALIFLLSNYSFAQNDVIVTQKKKEIVKAIIDSICNEIKDAHVSHNLLAITCSVDTRFREVSFTHGFGGEAILYSDWRIDTLLVESLSKLKDYQNFSLIEKSLTNTHRNLIIKSSSFLEKDTCVKRCIKIYLEIGVPIEGWEYLSFFNLVWSNSFVKDKEEYLKYSIPQLTVPVFVYQDIGGEKKVNQYVFRYQLKYKNDEIEVVPNNQRLLLETNR